MKKLSNTEAELKKALLIKKACNLLENDVNLILESVEDKWKHLKTNLLKTTEVSCGLSKNEK